MKRFPLSLSISASVVAMLAMTSCNVLGSGPDVEEEERGGPNFGVSGEVYEPPPPAVHPFEFTLEVPAEVDAGESVAMKFGIRNAGTEADVLEVGSSGGAEGIYYVLFVVTDLEGRVIYERFPSGAVLNLAGGAIPLEPDETKVLVWPEEWESGGWDQRDMNGDAVAPGRYQVFGSVRYTVRSETRQAGTSNLRWGGSGPWVLTIR